MSTIHNVTSETKRRAAKTRWDRPDNVDRRIDALAEHVSRIVGTLPPLTAEQRARLLATLLTTPAGGAQ